MPATVLWRNGIGFGGAIAFIFGDLIILPILNIYRKYYGGRVAVYRTGGIGMLRVMQMPSDHMAHHASSTPHEPVAGGCGAPGPASAIRDRGGGSPIAWKSWMRRRAAA